MTSNNHHPTLTSGFILDFDGTLMKGCQPLPGLAQFFDFAHQGKIECIIATNNAQHSPLDYQHKLGRCGVSVAQNKIITSAIATASTLNQQLPQGSAVYVIGCLALVTELQKAGFTILQGSQGSATAVIVGGDPLLTYEKLKQATLHIQRGALFIGTNPDIVYPTEEGLLPECGTTLAALQAATGVQPLIIGKPEATLFHQAGALLGTLSERTFVVGDRLETDILGGQRAGYQTILITTGVDQASSIREKAIFPDFIVQDLFELTILIGDMI